MAGHCDKLRSQTPKLHRKHPRTLRGIHNKRYTVPFAHSRKGADRQDIPEHIGNMGKDHRVRTATQGAFEFRQGIIPIKEFSPRHFDLRSQRMKRPGHSIMLKTGDHYGSPRFYQCADGDIQAMGAIGSKYHLLRLAVKQRPSLFPTAVDCPCRRLRSPIAAPSRIGTALHRMKHRLLHTDRFVKGCGTIVQIDHNCRSSGCPFPSTA